MGRAGSPDQRREEGGQRKDERRPRWVDVKRAHHAVISRHFVCFDVVSAAAAASAPGWGWGQPWALRCTQVHTQVCRLYPLEPVREAGTGLQHRLTFTCFDCFDVIMQQRVAFDEQGTSHLVAGILAIFINNIFMLMNQRRRWNQIGPPCH